MPSDIRAILALEVPVIVRVAERTMTLREVLSLLPGSIIELPKNSEDELDLLVNNKQIGMGTGVKVGENFGLRITYIGDIRERILALGGQSAEPQPEPSEDQDLGAMAESMLAAQL